MLQGSLISYKCRLENIHFIQIFPSGKSYSVKDYLFYEDTHGF